MTNLELAKEQGNQAAPNIIDAAKASEVQIDVTLAQEQGNQAAPLIADSLANSELYDAIKQQGNQAMPLIVDALVQPIPSAESPMYFEAAQANSTVSMRSTLETAPNLEYSTDGITWQEWEHTTSEGTHTFDIITLGAVGDKVYFRGDNPDGLVDLDAEAFSNFVLTGAINGGGNVMSLLDKTIALTEVPTGGFGPLFAIMGEDIESALLTPPAMDFITSIGDHGCVSMFGRCNSLTTAADMPVLATIGDQGCNNMYVGCTSLTSAANMPVLTAISSAGCNEMYLDCTFDMSNDGETLNFAFPTPPVTAGGITFNTAYDVAEWMGNTNGFGGAEQ